jgi:hypothetical protein
MGSGSGSAAVVTTDNATPEAPGGGAVGHAVKTTDKPHGGSGTGTGSGTAKPPAHGKDVTTGGGGAAVDAKDKHKPGDPKSLDDLIDEAAGGSGAKKPAGGDAVKATLDKKELTSSDIRTGMSSVSKRAQACFDKFGVSGTVGIKAVVAPSGQITKVAATGAFAGTPTGECVAAAVSNVSFPAWDGPPMTINYSYLLSE